MPLGLVCRLEEIATDKIELSNGRYMVQYRRQQLMPLVQIEGGNIQSSGSQPILVFADGRSMGLVVDEIIDIVEERLNSRGLPCRYSRLGRGQGSAHRSTPAIF
jgi:two-component system, chemotaxis family, sensor kinase CheA